jgi:hypothetical protein
VGRAGVSLHGMQEARGSNPLSSTLHTRRSTPLPSAAVLSACPLHAFGHGRRGGLHVGLEGLDDQAEHGGVVPVVCPDRHPGADLTLEEPDIEDIVRRIYRGETP